MNMARISKRQGYLAASRIAEKIGRTFMEYDPKTYRLRDGTLVLKPTYGGFELVIKGKDGGRHPWGNIFSAKELWNIDRFLRDMRFATPKRKMKKLKSTRCDKEGKVIFRSG